MNKIRLSLFEAIVTSIIIPNIGICFTTVLLAISLFVKQESVVYNAIVISYIACVLLMGISLLLCFALNRNSSKVLVLETKSMTINDKKYDYTQVVSGRYYVCKWYMIPFACFYKKQAAGLVTLITDDSKKIRFKVLYRDYMKIKNKIETIQEV